MLINVNNSKIIGYATVGMIPNGIEIDESILPSNFFINWYPEKFLYINGTVTEDPEFIPPPEPEPKPSPEERIAELEAQNIEIMEQNQMLKDCILEMSEIIYGE